MPRVPVGCRAGVGGQDRAVREAVATLSTASRGVVALHYLEELPLAEVADVLELPLGTVKSRLAYGLAQLRKTLKDPR